MKNICASKDTIKKVKRQLTNWEEFFANHISDKELIFKMYKEVLVFNSKRTNNLILKRAKFLIAISLKKVYKWLINT